MASYDFRAQRLFVADDLAEGVEIVLAREPSHYVLDVLRLGEGDAAGRGLRQIGGRGDVGAAVGAHDDHQRVGKEAAARVGGRDVSRHRGSRAPSAR